MKIIIPTLFVFLLTSCGQPNVVNEVRVVHHDWFVNGKKSIDSLKDLSIKAGMSGDFKRMKDLCELVATSDSNDADNLSRLSMVYMIEKNYSHGLKAINRSIMLDTGSHYLHNYTFKACLFHELNIKDSADAYFNKMLKSNNHGLDLFALVEAYAKFGMHDKAEHYLDLLLSYYPKNSEALVTKSMYIGEKNANEAVRYLTRIENQVKSANFYFLRSVYYRNCDKYDSALVDADKAVKLGNGEPWYFTARGRARHKLKDIKGAESDYKYAIERGDTTAQRFNRMLQAGQ